MYNVKTIHREASLAQTNKRVSPSIALPHSMQTVLLPENKPREVGNLVTEVKLLMRNMDA